MSVSCGYVTTCAHGVTVQTTADAIGETPDPVGRVMRYDRRAAEITAASVRHRWSSRLQYATLGLP